MLTAPARLLRPLALLGLASGLAACEPAPVQREFSEFSSPVSIEIHGLEPARADPALQAVRVELLRLNADWHAWRPSALRQANAELLAGRSAAIPAALQALVLRAQPAHAASAGLFDPASGGLVELWGFHTDRFPVATPPPDEARIKAWLAQRPTLADVQLAGGRLSSMRPVQLDFSAIAKGLAAERAGALLRAHGVRDALLRMGSDDYLALGRRAGAPWPVALRDPFGGRLGGIAIGDGEALFTTGNFDKFRASPDGGRWPHLLDPRTGYPARGAAMTAVLHRDAPWANAAAAALFVAGPGGFVDTAEGMGLGCALMVTEENELLITAQMQRRVQLQRNPVSLGEPLDLGDACEAAPAQRQ